MDMEDRVLWLIALSSPPPPLPFRVVNNWSPSPPSPAADNIWQPLQFSFLVLWSWFSKSSVLVFWQSSVHDNSGSIANVEAWWVKAYHVVLWPCLRVVSFDEKLCFFLSLFTQVYKWVLLTYCRGVTSCLTSIPSPQYSQLFCTVETGYVSPVWASLARVRLLPYLLRGKRLKLR